MLVVKENLSLIKEIRVKYRPFLTVIHLDQETSIFSGFRDLQVDPGEGVLIQATGERIKISSVEELESKIKTAKPWNNGEYFIFLSEMENCWILIEGFTTL